MNSSPITFCISTFNNLNYLQLAVKSVRTYSHFKGAPFIIYSENSTDGTDEWITNEGSDRYGIEGYIEKNDEPKGIGGGMNYCAEKVKTPWIMFMHADFFVSKNWDIHALQVTEKHGDAPIWVSSYRIQPNIFHEESRPGTFVVPPEEFGEYYHNFDEKHFIEVAEEFANINSEEIRKGEGVSGLIRRRDWDEVGGNDQLFAPAYYEDYDLFTRMQLAHYKFVLTPKSVVYHFGSRASRFPDDNLNYRKPELANYEQKGFEKWIKKWGQPPKFDENGFIIPIKGTNNPLKV